MGGWGCSVVRHTQTIGIAEARNSQGTAFTGLYVTRIKV